MTSEEAWLIAIVGGALATVLAAGLLRIFSRAALSRKIWQAVSGWVRWPLSLRVTTSARQAAAAATTSKLRDAAETNARKYREVCDVLDVRPVRADSTLVVERIQRLQEASIEAWKHARDQIEATHSLAVQEAARAENEHRLALVAATEAGAEQGRAAALAEIEAQRAVRLPQPVWRVDELQDSDVLILRNTQPDVVVSDVSLQVPLGDFAFAGPSQWPGRSTGVVEFRGTRQGNGRAFGVRFIVHWRDAHGDPRVGEAFVDKSPRKASVR